MPRLRCSELIFQSLDANRSSSERALGGASHCESEASEGAAGFGKWVLVPVGSLAWGCCAPLESRDLKEQLGLSGGRISFS